MVYPTEAHSPHLESERHAALDHANHSSWTPTIMNDVLHFNRFTSDLYMNLRNIESAINRSKQVRKSSEDVRISIFSLLRFFNTLTFSRVALKKIRLSSLFKIMESSRELISDNTHKCLLAM